MTESRPKVFTPKSRFILILKDSFATKLAEEGREFYSSVGTIVYRVQQIKHVVFNVETVVWRRIVSSRTIYFQAQKIQ